MMINRHNYEEFFLLYADDELNSQQRAAVELFVQQNPDMAAELEMLMQMKLEPEDDIVFPDKALLFKTVDVEININNYEEYFLLYIDGELEKRAAEKVEKFVLQHPKLQDEFTLLKQTVLQPEALTFADKSSLYRKEERRKVGYMQFARLAAAAAIIGLVLAGWWFYPKNQRDNVAQPVAVATLKTKGVSPLIAPKLQTVTPQKQERLESDVTASVAEVKTNGKIVTPKSIQKDSRPNVQQSVPPVKADDNVVAVNPKIDRPADVPVAITTTGTTGSDVTSMTAGVNTGIGNIKPELVLPQTTSGNVGQTVATGTKTQDNPFIAKPNTQAPATQAIAYKEIDTNDDDRSMYVGSLELNKDKVKGFLKRAGRLFGSRSKKDAD